MKLNVSFSELIKNYILTVPKLRKTYSIKHPNTKYTLEQIIFDILYVLKTGISWRNLRSTINWMSLYWHFKLLSSFNVFANTFEQLRRLYIAKHDISIQIIDSTFIMNRFGKNKISRNKFFKNKNCNKISLVTDTKGIPLSVLFDTGNKHDLSFVYGHVNDINNIVTEKFILLADKGYVSKKVKTTLSTMNCDFIFPPKRNMKQVLIDKILYKKRINVEHSFATLKQYRRIAVRCDSNLKTFISFTYMALSLMIYRNL